ncbi:MAG TPA: carboxypeptidase regulatory-like domain-containing protein, partial [Candidatus Binatia bacterium]|nr:carboxypeptidase regulatory-like domain-containing protein [Candidatus Binatia bacterium]
RFDDLPGSIVHFPFVRGTRAFFSYYTAGVRMWDISNPAQPAEVGFYDTWPGDDGIYSGAYECTPFYPSGILTATDRSTGLYVFRPQTTYGIVRGTVRDAGSGMKPVAGVSVRALPNGPATLSAADGTFALGPSSGPAVTIEASKFGYGTQSAVLAIAQGSDQTSNVSISKTGTGNIKGIVRRASDQSIITGANITLVGTAVAIATNAMGKYSLSKMPVGAYTIRADYVGLVPAGVPINLTVNPTLTVDFTLQTPPFYDDAETDRGWTLGAPDDDAIAGRWIRAVPIGTMNGSFEAQPSADHSPAPGTMCFVTGNAPPGSPVTQESVRGGKTTLISPPLDLSAISDPRIAYWLWFWNSHQAAGPLASTLTTEISNDGGLSWTSVSTYQAIRDPWNRIEIRVSDYFASPGSSVRLRIIVENHIAGEVEAALDDFEYYSGVSSGSLATEATRASRATLGVRSLASSPTRGGMSWEIALDAARHVRADLFDVQGRLVRKIYDGELGAGRNTIRWDGRLANGSVGASGIYWVRVAAEGMERNIKLVVAR